MYLYVIPYDWKLVFQSNEEIRIQPGHIYGDEFPKRILIIITTKGNS